jgi:hypothetical protein
MVAKVTLLPPPMVATGRTWVLFLLAKEWEILLVFALLTSMAISVVIGYGWMTLAA